MSNELFPWLQIAPTETTCNFRLWSGFQPRSGQQPSATTSRVQLAPTGTTSSFKLWDECRSDLSSLEVPEPSSLGNFSHRFILFARQVDRLGRKRKNNLFFSEFLEYFQIDLLLDIGIGVIIRRKDIINGFDVQ